MFISDMIDMIVAMLDQFFRLVYLAVLFNVFEY